MPHAVRIYPNPGGQPDTTLASQLLGLRAQPATAPATTASRASTTTSWPGDPSKVATARGPVRPHARSSTEVLEPGADGEDITISIDASLQLQLEKELYAAWVADKAKRVSGLVMDPEDGRGPGLGLGARL